MAKSLHEQVAKKCIHFNGIMNKTCRAGIAYDDVKDKSQSPFRFPCLQQGGQCSKAEFLTEGQIQEHLKEMGSAAVKNLTAYLRIKDFLKTNKVDQGKIPCDCGGDVRFVVSGHNGHIWCRCTKCDIGFNE
jgi:hypothetical protein